MISLLAPLPFILARVFAEDFALLNPCRLVCHLEHSIDSCKIVESETKACTNFYWTDASKHTTVVDKVTDDDYVAMEYAEAVVLLKVGKGGCEKLCQKHVECIDIGSDCKSSGVCLNLFWNRGEPVRDTMTTCYQLSASGCEDATPVLCGPEAPPKQPEEANVGGGDHHFNETETKRLTHVSSGASTITVGGAFLLVASLL